jgi:hypothetical protein
MVSSHSETESDCDEVDQLSCSLHKMSISSPAKSSDFESSVNAGHQCATEERSLRIESWGGARSVSSSYTSNGSSPKSVKTRPWEVPLPKPRVSPKLSIDDAIGRLR